jgi:spore maturation protein CgeB
MKILFTGNLFHDYELDMLDGLLESGHDADIRFNNIQGPFHLKDVKTVREWIKYGLLPYKLKINYFTKKSVDKYNKDLQDMMKAKTYDMLLVVGAKTIYPETISMFKGRKVFWFMDGLPRYEYVVPKIPLFDDLFVFEPTDVAYIREKLNREATFLTLAFSPKKYYRINGQPLVNDISFVGSYYPNRDELLNSLLDVSDSMQICGDFFRSQHDAIRKKVKGINVPHKVANELYNSSRININIHHAQSKEGLSIRTFEIIGAGGFEMVERQKAALEMFEENKNIVFYSSAGELKDKCRYYLANEPERKKIADAAYEEALRNHTWKRRLEQMFELLK